MNRRRAWCVLAALVFAGSGAAAQSAAPDRPAARRRARRRQEMIPPPPPPPIAARGEPAPVPNRDIEAPRRAVAGEGAPRLDPALIDPRGPRLGATTDPHGPQAREDRLLREPAAGARLLLPFGY